MIFLLVLFQALTPNPPRLAVTAIDGVAQGCVMRTGETCAQTWSGDWVQVVPAN